MPYRQNGPADRGVHTCICKVGYAMLNISRELPLGPVSWGGRQWNNQTSLQRILHVTSLLPQKWLRPKNFQKNAVVTHHSNPKEKRFHWPWIEQFFSKLDNFHVGLVLIPTYTQYKYAEQWKTLPNPFPTMNFRSPTSSAHKLKQYSSKIDEMYQLICQGLGVWCLAL